MLTDAEFDAARAHLGSPLELPDDVWWSPWDPDVHTFLDGRRVRNYIAKLTHGPRREAKSPVVFVTISDFDIERNPSPDELRELCRMKIEAALVTLSAWIRATEGAVAS